MHDLSKLTVPAILLLLVMAPVFAAESTPDVPPPTTVDDKGVLDWMARYIKADGWTVIAADQQAIALGDPSGVAVMPDKTMKTRIRHEYFRLIQLGTLNSRSNLQDWIVDCEEKRLRIVAMQIFTLNNLQGDGESRENASSSWTVPPPDSVNARTVERICRAPTEGKPLPVGAQNTSP